MAEDSQATEQSTDAAKESKGGASTMKKLLVFGVPAFLVQLVIVYFLTAKFVVPMTVHDAVGNSSSHKSEAAKDEKKDEDEESSDGEAKEQHIYVVKDMIINPAGTNGQRYLLTTIAFNLSTEEALKDLGTKEMAVRDVLNSVLTSKGMEELIDVRQRESLRKEIAERTRGLVAHGKLTSVYFSKYIIQ